MSKLYVSSTNGRIHLAERKTKLNPQPCDSEGFMLKFLKFGIKKERSEEAKNKKPKENPGFVRKLCDGQWVNEKKIRSDVSSPTCPVCMKLGM